MEAVHGESPPAGRAPVLSLDGELDALVAEDMAADS